MKFPVTSGPRTLRGASVVIWTTTPWTIPGNRAVSYSPRIAYGLYEVTAAPDENWAKAGDRFVLADALAADVMAQARVESLRARSPTCRRSDFRRPWSPRIRCAECGPRRLRLRRAAPARRPRHRGDRHRLRPHRARPWPRGLRHLDGASRASWRRAASTRRSPTRSMRTARSPRDAPGFAGRRVHHRQGREGRRQQGRHRRARRSRRCSSRAAG